MRLSDEYCTSFPCIATSDYVIAGNMIFLFPFLQFLKTNRKKSNIFFLRSAIDFLRKIIKYVIQPSFLFRYRAEIKTKNLLKEVEEMENILCALNCDITFSHNDLLLKNIVLDEARGRHLL